MKQITVKYCLSALFLLISTIAYTQTSQSLWVGQSYTCDAASSMMGSVSDVSWSCNGGYLSLTGSGFYRDVRATQYWSGTASVTCTWRYTLYYGQAQQHGSRTWYFTCRENPVHITPTEMTLAVGEVGHVGYYHDYDNSYTSYANAYFSCSSSCVSVTSSGTVTAKSPGTAYINVYSKLSNAANAPYCKVVVKDIAVENVSIAGNIDIDADATKDLSYSVYPSNATVKSVKWNISEGSDYISLTTSGTLKGKKPGTAKIYCTINGSVNSNTATVRVSEPPFTVSNSKPSNNDVGVSAFVTPSVTYSLALYEGDNYSDITLKSTSGNTVEVLPTISGNTVSIKPLHPLAEQTKYTLFIPANAVKNKWGTHYSKDVSISFSTGDYDKLTLSASQPAGFVPKGISVTLTASRNSATIYYTTNGLVPNSNSPIYKEPLVIDKDTRLRAVAMEEGYRPSDELLIDYVISNVDVLNTYPKDDELLYIYNDVLPSVSFSNKMLSSSKISDVKILKDDVEIPSEAIVVLIPNGKPLSA